MLTNDFHRNDKIVRVGFPYHREIIRLLQKETTSKWSQTLGCWYIPENDFNLGRFFTAFKPVAYIDYSELKKSFYAQLKKTIK